MCLLIFPYHILCQNDRGLVTYREVDLMIDEQKASSQQKQRVAIVVTHELAHQWFGNLVTMEVCLIFLSFFLSLFISHCSSDNCMAVIYILFMINTILGVDILLCNQSQ